MSAHKDELRPPLPYVKGAQLQIRPHVPPLPLGEGYIWPQARRALTANIYETYMYKYKTPSQLCLKHPPLETPPHRRSMVRCLTIIEQVACGDTRGSQVVTCRLNDQDKVRVAKIFDPLYYDFESGMDPTYYADKQYTPEAAAYLKIYQEGLDGKFTPAYHGAWTFDMPLLDGQLRQVRMVLMQHLPHPTMKTLIDSGQSRTFLPC